MHRLLSWLKERRATCLAAILGGVFVLSLQMVFGKQWQGQTFYEALDNPECPQVSGKSSGYTLGWPTIFLKVEHLDYSTSRDISGVMDHTQRTWHLFEVAFDLAAGIAVICSLAYLSHLRQRHGDSGQYSLSTLMAIVFALAVSIVTIQKLGPSLGIGELREYLFEPSMPLLYDVVTVGSIACIVFAATWAVKNSLLKWGSLGRCSSVKQSCDCPIEEPTSSAA